MNKKSFTLMHTIEKLKANKNKENLLKTSQEENKQTNAAYKQRTNSGYLTTILEVRKQ